MYVAKLVPNIRQFLMTWDGLQIKFLSRELNSLADCLAKNGSNGCRDRLEWGDIV